jgi:hypothetical protein
MVVFAKCNWIGGNFKISEGWFCKHIFLTLFPVKKYIFIQKFHLKCMCKKIYIYPKVSFEMYVLNCVKIWVKL